MSQAPHVVRGARWGRGSGRRRRSRTRCGRRSATPTATSRWPRPPRTSPSGTASGAKPVDCLRRARARQRARPRGTPARSPTRWCRSRSRTGRPSRPLAWAADEHMRPDTTPEGSPSCRPYFRKDGVVTAGNASGICDGAAALVVAERDLRPRAGPRAARPPGGWGVAGVDPAIMGIGPVPAVAPGAGATPGSRSTTWTWSRSTRPSPPSTWRSSRSSGSTASAPTSTAAPSRLGHPLGASGARITAAPAPRAPPPRRTLRPRQRLHRRRPGHRGGRRSLPA